MKPAAAPGEAGSAVRWSALRAFAAVFIPGLLVAATGIGAGDLITAALAGIRTGVDLLWAVAIGALLKCALTEGLARFQLATDRSLLEGWVRHLGFWIRPVFLSYFIVWSFVVAGALMNACGVAGTAIYPLHADSAISKIIWGLIHSVAACALIWLGGLRLFEGVMSAAVFVMFFAVLAGAALLRPDMEAIARGLFVPGLREAGDVLWVFALVGGVGGTVTILSYGYWIREHGRQGAAGLRKSRIDLTVAYVLTALFSIAMIALADRLAVEFQDGGSKIQLPLLLAAELRAAIGPIGETVFLYGFWAAVFSSMLGVWQSAPYLFADFARLWKASSGSTPQTMTQAGDLRASHGYRLYLPALATLPAITLFLRLEIVQLTYAVLGAFFMPMLAGTLLYLNNRRELVGEFRNRVFANLTLAATLCLFAFLGARQLLKLAGL